jgi:rRNA maturation RNase YbeY
MRTSVVVRCPVSRGMRARVAADARRLLRALGEGHTELTVSLVDDAEMRRLNCTHRGTNRPTDVLAFAMREGPRAPGDHALLGDVVISWDTATRQARRGGVTPPLEIRPRLLHRVLHLLGYDHERSATEAHRMRAAEQWLRAALASRRSLRSPARLANMCAEA